MSGVKAGLIDMEPLEQSLEGRENKLHAIWRRGNIMCKGPEVGLRKARMSAKKEDKEESRVGHSSDFD